MNSEFRRLAQQILIDRAGAQLKVDGIFGPASIAAAVRHVGAIQPAGQMTADRWATLVIQDEANLHPAVPHTIKEDGWWGPATQDAAHRILGHPFARPDDAGATAPTPHCWTPTDHQMLRKYGHVGTRQTVLNLPYPMRLDWDLNTPIHRVTCHTLFAGPLAAALETIRDSYPPEDLRTYGLDRFGGILNVRKKRGGTTWSAHAWGTAIDLWPSANQLHWKKNRAVFARPEYGAMRQAFADAGLMSLGTCFDFDWMHFQLNP